MSSFDRGIRALIRPRSAQRDPPNAENAVTVDSLGLSGNLIRTDQEAAMRISTVSRCIDILSDSTLSLSVKEWSKA